MFALVFALLSFALTFATFGAVAVLKLASFASFTVAPLGLRLCWALVALAGWVILAVLGAAFGR